MAECPLFHDQHVTIKGCEPVYLPGGPTAFLVIHGWCATSESVRFLTAGLAEAGYTVLAPTMPGHGTNAVDLSKFGPIEWFRSVQDAAKWMHEHYQSVVVLGVSMGGALALQLAALSPHLVTGVVTVNAPVYLNNPEVAGSILTSQPLALLSGWQPPQFYGPPVDEISYKERTTKSAADLLTTAALANALLASIKTPLCVIQSKLDPIVPPECAQHILQQVTSAHKQLHWLHHSYHISQLDTDREAIVQLTVEFAQRLEI